MALIPMLLESISIKDRLCAIRLKERVMGRTLLQCVAHDPVILEKTLDFIPETHHFEAINALDDLGRDLFYFASKNTVSLEIFLRRFPEQCGLIARRVKDYDGQTRVHHVLDDTQALEMVLQLYPLSEQKTVALTGDKNGYTPLHLAVMKDHSKAVRMLLQLFLEGERPAILRIKDSENNSILDYARSKPTVMQVILDSLRPDIALIQKELNYLIVNSSSWFWDSNRKKKCQLEAALKKGWCV